MIIKAACVASLLAIVSGPAAYAQSGLSFPMIGIATGQAARLNVVNLAANNPMNPSSCSVELQFLDTSGKQIKQNSAQIPAGQALSLELRHSDLPGDHQRSEVRAVLLFGSSGGAAPPTTRTSDCGSLLPSLEVYDRDTGKTSLVVTGAKELPAPLLPLPM